MRAPRDVLKHVCVQIAERQRKCHRDRNHSISKGEKCLVVTEGSFGGKKNYCTQCAAPILSAIAAKHQRLLQEMAG
jgi:hypothetical protein